MSDNGTVPIEIKPSPDIVITIHWSPQQNQLRVMWPQVDDVIKLGLIEFAKVTLLEMRAKQGLAQGDVLVVPAFNHAKPWDKQ